MPQFHSRGSTNPQEAQPVREPGQSRASVLTPPPVYRSGKLPPAMHTDHLPAVAGDYHSQSLQLVHSEQYTPAQGYPYSLQTLQDGRRTTQSLVLSIPGAQPTSARAPLVIPGAKKRRRSTIPLQNTDELEMRAQRGLHLRTRHLIAIASTLGILLFTLLSLNPVGTGTLSSAYMSIGSVRWTQADRQNWDIAVKRAKDQPAVDTTIQEPVTGKSASEYSRAELEAIARQAAAKYGIDPVLFIRQIQKESGFNPYAQSWVGASGIAQFMPATAAEMGVNPWDPVDSLFGAARYMASLRDYFNGDYEKAVAAYNWGAGNVENAVQAYGSNWLNNTPHETYDYVGKIYGWIPMN